MTDRINAKLIETLDPQKPLRLTPAQAGGPIHTRSYAGYWRLVRLLGTGALFTLFFGTAWLNYNGRQAVLWDLEARQFHIFGATFVPQDFILLSALLIIAAFGLFFITVLAGRVWCGYACPQSTWTWLFMWAEKVTEGDRSQRIKLDAAPWGWSKLLKRSAKHSLWLLMSLVTGLTFIGYFTPIRELFGDLITLQMGWVTAFWVGCFTLATYANAGWLREQVCLHMCPYSRFQSVMMDQDTLTVTYDAARGEPRGARRKDQEFESAGLGSCIDCTLCVQVCPTGIDIRDGLQLNCIGCGACVDACDSIMDKMGYARGLVRYTSEHQLKTGKTRWWRPRLMGYAAVLLLMIASFSWALAERDLIKLNILRDRGLYTYGEQGAVENHYRLKIINKTQEAGEFVIALDQPSLFQLRAPHNIRIAAGEVREVPVTVTLKAGHKLEEITTLTFSVSQVEQPDNQVQEPSTFLAPYHL